MNKITIISSFYNADIYIDKFLDNVSNINGYDTLCIHHAYNILGSHKDNKEICRKLEEFAKIHHKFEIINVRKDPGLYELWNTSAKNAKTEYLMTFNIDDRCSPNYIQTSLYRLTKYNADLVCATIKVTDKKNGGEGEYNNLWYDTKPIYYDSRFSMNKQLKEANVINIKGHWVELQPNSIYKRQSHRIDPKYKKLIKVYYHRITLEDMFADWKCNNEYISYNIPHCMPIWRKDLHKYGYFDENTYGVCADYEFWLRILKEKKDSMFMITNKPIILYLEDIKSHNRRDSNKNKLDEVLKEVYLGI